MRFSRFTDEYDEVARFLGTAAGALRSRDRGLLARSRYLAVDGDELVGVAMTTTRPDGRAFINFTTTAPELWPALCALALQDHEAVHITVDASDTTATNQLIATGFSQTLQTDAFAVPVDLALNRLRRARVPRRFRVMSANDVPAGALSELDNRLRQDVPGTSGWEAPVAWVADELDDAAFDPSGYLVAVEADSDHCVGLVRFWRNPSAVRLGLLGVLPAQRRSLLASGLLRRGIEAVKQWGESTFVTETSPANTATHPALLRLGLTPTATLAQFTLEPPHSPQPPP